MKELQDFFQDKLSELKENSNVTQLFNMANKKECEIEIRNDKTLFHNECVRSYYNKVRGTLENYVETGVYTNKDVPELANYVYEYYLALKFSSNNLGYDGMQFDYNEESIEHIIKEFLELVTDIHKFSMRSMMQD